MNILLTAILAASCLMPTPPPQQARPHILLLVDDNDYDLMIERYHLREYDCIINDAQSFTEGLKLLSEQKYDFAFVDLWLDGGRTAIDLIRTCRARNPLIEFYVISGNWAGTVGSRMLLETMSLNQTTNYKVAPVVKGHGTPTQGDLRGFAETLERIQLRRK